MNVVTSEFRQVVERLISKLKPTDFIDAEEKRLSQEFHTLPLGISLWSYGFLTSDGELVETDWEPDEILRTKNIQEVTCAIAIAARRFPQLKAFIPSQPKDSIVCPACQGTKLWGTNTTTGEPARCVFCAGLGWRYNLENVNTKLSHK
ncbi:MAG TPA: hypothetical protein VF596_11765 [Pyrinomonadaceae bacterium]|jgi:hypothetical protein